MVSARYLSHCLLLRFLCTVIDILLFSNDQESCTTVEDVVNQRESQVVLLALKLVEDLVVHVRVLHF